MDLSFFKENGYQVIRNFFPKKILNDLKGYLNQEALNTLEKIRDYIPFSTEASLVEKIGELVSNPEVFDRLDPALKQWLSGHYPLEVRLSNQVLSLFRLDGFKHLYQAIFPGYAPKMHLPPVIRFVLPGNQYAAVPPHQDVSYNQHMDEFFTVWMPFQSIDQQCGGVEIFEGTQDQPNQLTGSQQAKSAKRQFWLKGLNIETHPLHLEMEISDILLLNKHIIHRSRANLSDSLRISADFRFFKTCSSKHFLDFETFETIVPETQVKF